MNTLDTIYNRRSVRKFKDRPVEKATIEQLLNAAVQAPSAMNSQPWAFGAIQDANLLLDISNRAKAYLLATLDERPLLQKYRASFENPDFNIFYNASSLLIVFVKPGLSPDPKTDCCLAAENLMLAAHDLGLGTCWIGFARAYLNTPEAKELLDIPDDYEIVAPLVVGYPEGELANREKNPPEMLFWK